MDRRHALRRLEGARRRLHRLRRHGVRRRSARSSRSRPGVGEVNGLALAPGRRIQLGISAPCDHCTPTSELSGAVVSFLPDGTDLQADASGIRAPIGLAVLPGHERAVRDDEPARRPRRPDPGRLALDRAVGPGVGIPRLLRPRRRRRAPASPGPSPRSTQHAAVSGVAIVTGQLGTTTGTAALVAEWQTGKVQRVGLRADGSPASAGAGDVPHRPEEPVRARRRPRPRPLCGRLVDRDDLPNRSVIVRRITA